MPRATCRCGQKLSFPADGPDRVICPKCGSRIRVKRAESGAAEAVTAAESSSGVDGDGYLRFPCPCGRRLKVRDTSPRPQAGKCPDCGRVVPVPSSSVSTVASPSRSGSSSGHAETPTEVMTADELAALDRWAESHRGSGRGPAGGGFVPVPGSLSEPQPATELAFPDNPPAAAAAAAGPATIPAPTKVEAGLRVCPRCGRPVHLGSDSCRQCGAPVPRR